MGENREIRAGAPDIRWLVAGALAGLIAAAFGILRQADSGDELPANAVARVNDFIISRDNYERAVARVTSRSADELSGDERAAVLQRLVDDELLVQRALELSMAQSDMAVRGAIMNSLVASVTAEADAASPGDAELQRYLSENADRFSYTAKLSLAGWQTDDESAAQTFVTALRSDGVAPPSETVGPIPDLPPGLMPVETLRAYLGPGVTAAAAEMPEGSSAVFARRGRWLVVQILAKQTAVVTDLSSVRNRVLLDYRRTLADQTLRDYIDDLRRRADVDAIQP